MPAPPRPASRRRPRDLTRRERRCGFSLPAILRSLLPFAPIRCIFETPSPFRSVPMVLVILLVLALFVLQTLLPGRFREPVAPGGQGKLAENIGNRDHMRPLTVVG